MTDNYKDNYIDNCADNITDNSIDSSYQVLARKWRPSRFDAFVGQDQILQALRYALDNNSIHHAYLFTGTRGVGKTSLGRLMAKCLNCEEGVSSNPCDKCSSCLEINKGCFIDLIEIDAASRTKVEDTRELIENIQYSPTKGRFKIYLIDEVHMLSTHSFNALLKTLEEPPEHVKFLLATTECRKLPETILSRTIQFHLREINTQDISKHLAKILTKEKIEFDSQALSLIAKHARGSMRDALSFLDRMIATGSGKVILEITQSALGCAPFELIFNLVEMLLNKDVSKLLPLLRDDMSGDFNYLSILDAAANFIYELSFAQHLVLIDNNISSSNITDDILSNISGFSDFKSFQDFGDKLKSLILDTPAEKFQFLYQCFLRGKEEIVLAPEPRVGFEMICLRFVSFFESNFGNNISVGYESGLMPENKINQNINKKSEILSVSQEIKNNINNIDKKLDKKPDIDINPKIASKISSKITSKITSSKWPDFASKLSINGLAKQLLLNISLIEDTGDSLKFNIDKRFKSLLNDQIKQRVLKAIQESRENVKSIEIITDALIANNNANNINSNKEVSEGECINPDLTLSGDRRVKKINKISENIKKITSIDDVGFITANFSVQLDQSSVNVTEGLNDFKNMED